MAPLSPPPPLPDVLALLQARLALDYPWFTPAVLQVLGPLPGPEIRLPFEPPAAAAARLYSAWPEAEATQSPARHSPDFHTVQWFGSRFEFTDAQASVIRILWEAWENETPSVSQSALLEGADSTADRLRDLFRDHPAWGLLIVPGSRRGTYRLADPRESSLP